MRKTMGFLIVFILFIALTKNVLAVSLTVSNFPSSISSEMFNVDVLITGASTGTNYLRIDLYKDGTTNYFGETYNGSDWYSGSDGKSYFPVQIQNSSGSATLQAQIGNPNLTNYPGPGTYKLKIRRYTSSGSQSSNDTQILSEIQITYATPTPTPSPTPSPTPIPTATSIPTATATHTPTPTPIKTSTPTVKPSVTFSPTPTSTVNSSSSPQVLSASTNASSTPNPTGSPKELVAADISREFPFIPVIFLVVGFGLIGFAIWP